MTPKLGPSPVECGYPQLTGQQASTYRLNLPNWQGESSVGHLAQTVRLDVTD